MPCNIVCFFLYFVAVLLSDYILCLFFLIGCCLFWGGFLLVFYFVFFSFTLFDFSFCNKRSIMQQFFLLCPISYFCFAGTRLNVGPSRLHQGGGDKTNFLEISLICSNVLPSDVSSPFLFVFSVRVYVYLFSFFWDCSFCFVWTCFYIV